jgi:formylglycine-generating enzyme required for sulfatase activity
VKLLVGAMTAGLMAIASFSRAAAGSRAEIVVPAGSYLPFFAGAERKSVRVASFRMDRFPVTNGDFLKFVRANPAWRKSRIRPLFTDGNYLAHWRGDLDPGKADPKSPVIDVSWFAAEAYCEWKKKTLPTVDQWEYAASDPGAAADSNREKILQWYSKPTPKKFPRVGTTSVSALGIRDLYGLVWEWTLDFNGLMQGEEARGADKRDPDLFCGAGSRGALDPSDYASFMRYSFRKSLKANYGVANLGFRCVKEEE